MNAPISLVVAALCVASCSSDALNESAVTKALNDKLAQTPVCETFSKLNADELNEFLAQNADLNTQNGWSDKVSNGSHYAIKTMASEAFASQDDKDQEQVVLLGLSEAGFLDGPGGGVFGYQTGGWFRANYSVAIVKPSIAPFLGDAKGHVGPPDRLLTVCFAALKVKDVERWSEPAAEASSPEALADFHIKAELQPPFAGSQSLSNLITQENAKPETRTSLRATLIKMNDGWTADKIAPASAQGAAARM